MAIWGDFQGLSGVTRGEGVKKLKIWDDVIYRWSLSKNYSTTYRGSLQFKIFGAKESVVNCKIVKIKDDFNTKTLK